MMIAVAMETTMNSGGNIAYGVVTGIGFLGGGAIIRYGRDVRGLVTGASIWSSAVIGLGFGLGWFAASGITTALVLGSLWVLQYIEMLLDPSQEIVAVRATTSPGIRFPASSASCLSCSSRSSTSASTPDLVRRTVTSASR